MHLLFRLQNNYRKKHHVMYHVVCVSPPNFKIWDLKKGKKEKKSRFGIPIAFISLCQSVVLSFVFFFWFFYEFL